MFKFIFAWLVSTFIWLTVWIPLYILGFLFIWIGLLFCNRNSEKLPKLWWLWDNSHGINGTIDYNNLNWVYICNPDQFFNKKDPIKVCKDIIDSKTGNERKYGNRWIWLAWRNPVSNPSMYMIGLKIKKPVTVTTKTFWRFIFTKVSSGFGWSYAFAFKYNETRGFYYSFGWKFNDPADGIARFIYRISPYRNFS